jgi:pyruvate, water dikinase
MGVLVHENFSDEQANGVAVTTDPFYQTEDNFYLNAQVGENLVTNPKGESVPEEVLLNKSNGRDFTMVRPSNRVPDGQQILTKPPLNDLQIVLKRIDATFRTQYKVLPWKKTFAIEVEFKITKEGAISIKQARPWVF